MRYVIDRVNGFAWGGVAIALLSALRPVPHHRPTWPFPKTHSSPPISRGWTTTSPNIQVDITAGHVLNQVVPEQAVGASVDAIGIGGISELFTPLNVDSMLSSGLGSLSYRLYTELNVEDWHWNPTGTWSDSANQQGYFVGSPTPGSLINDSYGYQLTHRGSTYDAGENEAYSLIDDGDPTTYWKSNPYLSKTYTNESDTLHPQWIVADLGTDMDVDAIKIQWANPYAVAYTVQYWTGDDAIYDPGNGRWVTFPSGTVTAGKGGTVTLQLATAPVSCEFIRVLMTQSSGTYDTHGTGDPRNKAGYAIFEVGIGELNGGTFTDYVDHEADQNQTPIYASSTDPWHTANGQDQVTEQIGLDYIFESALSKSQPMMVPTAMVYSTPDNAVAEAGYLSARGYPMIGMELGEEPDGQFMTPEDYGSLFLQWASAIHKSYPNMKLGGPVFSNFGVQAWPDSSGDTDWLKRFIAYLNSHSAIAQLGFVSSEHYPFDPTNTDWTLLAQERTQVQSIFTELTSAGVPKATPFYITEYNLSGNDSEVCVDMEGALWHAVFLGEFLSRGGAGSFYYQYFPYPLSQDGTAYGDLGMFTCDDNDQVTGTTSQFFSSLLISQLWCQPGTGKVSVWPSSSNIDDTSGNMLVLPYTVSRPDGSYAVLIVNTDSNAHTATITFNNGSNHYFSGLTSQFWVSPINYVWNQNGANGAAKPDGPIESLLRMVSPSTQFSFPAHSVTVLRGKIK